MNKNQDLLDLCRLNQMEENIENSPALDRGAAIQALDYKKRQLVTKIINNAPNPIQGAMDNHIERNTRDGVYPWTDTLGVIVADEFPEEQ